MSTIESLEPRRLMATYFVDANYTGATSNGAIGTPWKTIAQVEAFAGYTDNDIVRFARGRVWREQLDVPRSDLKFSSYTPGDGATAAPVITGAETIGGPSRTVGTSDAWFRQETGIYWSRPAVRTHVVIRNLNGVETWLNPAANYSGLSDANPWFYDASTNRTYLKSASDPDTIAGLKMEIGQRDRGVNTNGKSNITVENFLIGKTNGSAVFVTAGRGVTIQYNTLRSSNSAPVGGVDYGGAGVFVNFSPDCVVHANTVNEMRGEGIYSQGSARIRITNNTVTSVYRGVHPLGDSIQIGGRLANGANQNDGYVISGNTVSQQYTDTPKGCIIAQLGDNGTISNNTAAYGNFGIAVGGNNLLIERNTVRNQNKSNNSGGSALGVGFIVGGEDTEYVNDATFNNITFRHNVVHDTFGGLLMSGGSTYQRTGIRILNNTFYNCTETGININTQFSGQIRNNVLWLFAPTVTSVLRVLNVADTSSAASHNLFGIAKTNYLHWDGVNYSTAAAFSAGTGFTQVTHSDPQFASTSRASASFLRLTTASPARNAGTSSFYTPGQLDRAGNAAKYGTNVDLGAYELQTG